MDRIGDPCPKACAGRTGSSSGAIFLPPNGAGSSGGAGFQTVSCRTLIELEGGCAHDLSVRELTYPAGTGVSDMCPVECSGHVECAPAALDVSFLDAVEDSSGHGGGVELAGGACVDSGGLTLSGDGRVELTIGSDYYSDNAFSIAFWLLKHPADVWEASHSKLEHETVYFHPPRLGTVDASIHIWLGREKWLDTWKLGVRVSGAPAVLYDVNLIRDSTPMWAHVLVTVGGSEGIRVFENGIPIEGRPLGLATQWLEAFRSTKSRGSDPISGHHR
jgi:hypothetical protein